MTDMNRGARPLSPHLTVYRPQWTSVMSILHRITGVALTVSAALVTWWWLAAATGPDYFATADAVLSGWFGTLVLVLSLWALSYHFLNGLRHLWWDTGRGLEVAQVELSAKLTAGGSVALTVLVLLLI